MTDKGKFIVRFNEAFASGDIEVIAESITDDVVCNMVGHKTLNGKEAFMDEVNSMKDVKMISLTIENVITHGITAAANGEMETIDSESGKSKKYKYCDVYLLRGFKNPKIKEISSYIIEVD